MGDNIYFRILMSYHGNTVMYHAYQVGVCSFQTPTVTAKFYSLKLSCYFHSKFEWLYQDQGV